MTTAQRAMDRLAKSITLAFAGMGVKAEVVESSQRGAGFVGSGLRLRIDRRTATFDEHGQTVRVENEPTDADKAKAGDFSKVDWKGRG